MVWSKDEPLMAFLSRARLSWVRLGFSGGREELEVVHEMMSMTSSWLFHRNREDTGEERATSRWHEDVLSHRSSKILAWEDVNLS